MKHKNLPALLFLSLVAFSIIIIWWVSASQTDALSGRTFSARFLKFAGDAALLTVPFLFVGHRYRRLALIPLWVIALWCAGSVWYYRFWKDIPGIYSLLLGSNLNKELLYSVAGLWEWRDMVFLVIPAAVTLISGGGRSRMIAEARFSGWFRAAGLAGACGLFIVGQTVSSHIVRCYYADMGHRLTLAEATVERLGYPLFLNHRDLALNGPLVHFCKSVRSAVGILTLRKKLSPQDARTIERYIAEKEDFPALTDSLATANRRKNVIVILVESLNAYAIEAMTDGMADAPVMKSLVGKEGSLSALDVMTQVCKGGSGDGQLIANTGLYPLAEFSTAIALGGVNDFPGLPKILGREENVVVFGDDTSAWNEREAFSAYGFDKIYCRNDYPELVKREGGDGALMRFASSIIPKLKQPFFLELVTVSMHVPFSDPDIPDSKIPLRFRKEGIESAYAAMVNYFDTELGLFLSRLEAQGLLDNTILALVSDHSQELTLSDVDKRQAYVPMAIIIANCGITSRICRRTAQTDFYPTLLNLAGGEPQQGWRGAGTSLLSTVPATEEREREGREISEMILRTDFFSTKN